MSTLSPRRRITAIAALACAVAATGGLQTIAQAETSPVGGSETRPFEPGEEGMAGTAAHSSANSPARVPSANVPRPAPLPVASNPAAKWAEGLSMKDQRESNNGNSFSLEPPDQGLCVSDTQVIEGVNDVFAIHDKATGARSAPMSYDLFFNNVAEYNRDPAAKHPYGPFVSDPKCYWDPQLHRFYMTVLELGVNSTTGDFNGESYVDIAVSRDATPTTDSDTWFLYQLDVANAGMADTTTGSDGGALEEHAGCPCLGDQPLIGADRYGFYISTNEFPIEVAGFNGAQFYAFDKAALATGTLKVQRIESGNSAGIPLANGIAYSVQPATSPVASEWSSASNGTEYALSALDFDATRDDRIAAWSFTNTRSLLTTPNVHVTNTVISSEAYGQPPAVEQKDGPYPLGQILKDKLNLLNSNDDRMQQVVYSGGKLWSGLNTVVKTSNGPTTTGIAFFVVNAASSTIANQGYVSVNRNSVMFPSIGVAAGGTNAAMVFTLAGPHYYPSTAYVKLSPRGAVTTPVTIYAAGQRPADGFTGYPEFGGSGVERWGDYSAAVADSDGTIWTAAEYIPGTYGYDPTIGKYLANWGTAIGSIS